MEGELTRAEVAGLIADLAFARADDAVRLAFSPEDGTAGLNLQLVREVKRSGNGAVELKLLDREKLIELLVELLKPEDTENSEKLYQAIDNAAKQIGENKGAV